MGSHDPIAYTYDADTHCPDCAFKRFGRDDNGFVPESATDNEGNGVGAYAPWDEWWDPSQDGDQVLACSTCGGVIDRIIVGS